MIMIMRRIHVRLLVLTPLQNELAELLAPDDERVQVFYALSFWSALIVLVGGWNLLLWSRNPPPTVGSVSMDVVAEARAERRAERHAPTAAAMRARLRGEPSGR